MMINNNIPIIIDLLAKTYPDARCDLNYKNPFELLIATILSAQTTDLKVNQVTTGLFHRFPTPQKMLELTSYELENMIKSIGLFRTKAKNILKTCKLLVEKYDGTVPNKIEELIQLPGVGRKTASVVLANSFGIPAFPVDTHVLRVSNRLGLTKATDPLKVEKDLTILFPKEYWIDTHHRLIYHGRRLCSARRPQCHVCPLAICCPTPGNDSSSISSKQSNL